MKRAEDYIPCIVISRLKQELNLTYDAICAEADIPPSTLSGNTGTSSQASVIGFPSRITRLADYFQKVHGLEYVTSDYLLRGAPKDTEKINLLRKQLEIEEQMKSGMIAMKSRRLRNI